jgi:hypothetical protein
MNDNTALLFLSIASQAIAAALKIRQQAGRTREWTPEEEAGFDAKLVAAQAGRLPHWAIEPDPQ